MRTLDAAGGADAFDAMLEAGVLDHWLPEYAGSAQAARAWSAREEKADALRRLAAILPVDADATAIGKRLKLSTQESVRLQLMLDPANAIDTANLRGQPLSSRHEALHRPRCCSTRPATGVQHLRSPAAGRRRNCRSAATMRWRWA